MTNFDVDNLVVNTINGSPPGGAGISSMSGDAIGSASGGSNAVVTLGTPGRSMREALGTPIANPTTGLTFKQIKQISVIELIAKNLAGTVDRFTQDTGMYTVSFGVSDSYGSQGLSVNAGADHRIYVSNDTPPVPAAVVALEVGGIGSGSDFAAATVGFAIDSNNFVQAVWEVATGNVNIGKNVAGSYTTVGFRSIAMTAPFTLALSMSGENYTVWIDFGNGLLPIIEETVSDFNVMNPATLATMHAMFGANGGDSTPWVFKSFTQGLLGQNFLRDYRPVIRKDGTPYAIGGWHYFTATCDHCGIYRVNFSTGVIEKTGILMMLRSGSITFDLNAVIMFDPDILAWRIFSTNWGSYSNSSSPLLVVNSTTFKGEILNGVHVIDPGSALNLTSTVGAVDGAYDASIVFNPATSLWTVAYSVAPSNGFTGIHPRVDTSPDLVTFNNVGVMTPASEGTFLMRVGGTFYVTSGTGSAFECWELNGTSVGAMNATPYPSPGGAVPPHFVVWPVMEQGSTQFYAMSWQNTQYSIGGVGQGVFSNGVPIIYKAEEFEAGFEFDATGIA